MVYAGRDSEAVSAEGDYAAALKVTWPETDAGRMFSLPDGLCSHAWSALLDPAFSILRTESINHRGSYAAHLSP